MISLSNYPYFALDTETTGLKYPVDKAFGFSISLPDRMSYYFDIRHQSEMGRWLQDETRYYNGTIICHNASFDYRMLHSAGINIPIHLLDDTVIRACNINEHLMSYDLDYLAYKYLKKKKETDIWSELALIFGGSPTRKAQIGNIAKAPPEVVAPYAETDTDLTLELWEWQQKEIERQEIQDIMEFERRLIPTFIRAEMRGIRVDLNYAEEAAQALNPIIDQKQKELDRYAGTEVNVNSPPQVKALFKPTQLQNGDWIASDGTPLSKTPKGQASLGAEALRKINDPMAELILEIRSLLKTRDTFLLKHVIEHAVDGRVYPTINQSKGEDGGTGTGRLSYQDPAMQQIPSRNKKVAAIVKPCFLPDEGHVWVDSDKASFEVRVFYHLINNANINKLYAENPHEDGHQIVSNITGLPRNANYSGEPNAKQLNLSMIFNSGNGAIADKIGLPWEWEEFTLSRGKDAGKVIRYKKAGPEAMKMINEYHRKVPGVKELAESCKKLAERTGYLFTRSGRRLRFPGGAHSYAASGKLIQATAADLNKENWLIIEEVLGEDGHLILNTHDSYGMSLPENWEPYFNKVKQEIEKPRLRIPLILELSGVGVNWWDAIKED
ncbi:MAG: DNA polymerase I [Bacteroidetes bacterium]|nr:MAG: DNA polymerase I [Bacteroidota bacterium]